MTAALPLHGTLIEYLDTGIYLIGPSGSGKSETALQLIAKGARLVCDDAPLMRNSHVEKTGSNDQPNSQSAITGHCPEGFSGQMHIRNLGVINIGELFGQERVKNSQRIDFIIEISLTEDSDLNNTQVQYHYWTFQSQPMPVQQIPGVRLYRSAGRNMALMVHTAVLQFKATQASIINGYNI